MFGLSFSELLMVVLVALVVLGPKELPRYLRKAGQLAGRLRRMAYEMRERSGIDEVLRSEGLDRDLAEIRRLSRGELAGVVAAVRETARTARAIDVPGSPYVEPLPAAPPPVPISREREYPREGPDSYDALPDTASVYQGSLAPSPLASDVLYVEGREGAQPPPSP